MKLGHGLNHLAVVPCIWDLWLGARRLLSLTFLPRGSDLQAIVEIFSWILVLDPLAFFVASMKNTYNIYDEYINIIDRIDYCPFY